LRHQLRAAETAAGLTAEYSALLPLGISAIDGVLGGGLARGALHEIAAARETDIAAATGFALMAAVGCGRDEKPQTTCKLGLPRGKIGEGDTLQTPRFHPTPLPVFPPQGGKERCDTGLRIGNNAVASRTVVWIAEDLSFAESGAPYGPGLDEVGLAPERLIMVATARGRDVLWAMEEALRSPAVGAVIGEIRGERGVDAVATRRLSLAAAARGTLALLLRIAPGEESSAAVTRWVASATAHGIGPPRLLVRLVRNRRGHLESWILEWNRVEQRYALAPADSQPVADAAFNRPRQAAVE
jgi:protein ImuA